MTALSEAQLQLVRMEEARRQTRRQLGRIARCMTVLIPQLQPKRTDYRHGHPSDRKAFIERYRSNLAVITAERQPEIEALSRKLFRTGQAIAAFRAGRREPRSDR